MSYVNLHCHTHYSLLDGLGSPKKVAERAKELGMPACAITDHGNMCGAIEFYKACKDVGIKPIIGCEIYVARRTRFDKTPQVDVRPYHLTLLAKNEVGYKNLLEINTKANLEGFYYKPRADYGLIKAHSEGLIALSGCLQGNLPRAILSGDPEEADRVIQKNIEIFGVDNYFLEMQDHPFNEDQAIVNREIKKLSKKFGLDLVATNDTHYPRRGDAEAHDVLLCIQMQTTVDEENRMKYNGDFSIREVEDMEISFKDTPEALENTVKIAEMCDLELEFDQNLIPAFATPQNEKPEIYLRKLCEEGLKDRFNGKKVSKEYTNRLDYELDMVIKMGFATYFLIVRDFIRFAKEEGIVVGPGRGSAAGAIIAYSLGITELDPIAHGLFFERFLNPERVSMPDIDIDFADNRRQEVLDYVIEKYGRENVAQIITFGTMTAKAVVRDVGRALGVPYVEIDKLAKLIPPPVLGKHAPLKESMKDDPDLRNDYETNEKTRRVLDFAAQIEGTVRHAGTHACAVIISEKPLINYTPLQRATGGGDQDVVTQYSMKPLEEIGLLKMDFLGLKNLTVIEKTQRLVKAMKNEDVDLSTLGFEDKKTFKLLQDANTTGVFQLESAGMRRYLKELKPSKFEDIVAMGALYRPGPMEWIPSYIKGKHNPSKVKYLHKSFETVLSETYGVAVYQEQILQIARDFAGFSLGEADILRKAVGKKIPKLLAEQRDKFVTGSVEQGHKEKFAKEVFEKVIEPFAGYGFNKAHAACYGLIAFQTAYLKAHYPTQFMTALMCSDYGDTDRIVLEINECEEMGINVLPPSINESFANFTAVEEKKVRFGLMAIKGVGEGPVKEIINTRKLGGPFKDIEDFANRVPAQVLNKKLIQALALSGALDEFGDRRQISESYDEISKYAKYIQESQAQGQTDLFGALADSGAADQEQSFYLRDVPKASDIEKLTWEKEFLGLYVSNHPLHGLEKYLRKKATLIGELTEKQLGKPIKIIGIIGGIRKILTKAGSYIAIFVLEDPTAKVEVAVFTKNYHKLAPLLIEDQVVVVEGKFDNRRGGCQVICHNIKNVSLDTMIARSRELGSYKPDDKFNRYIPFIGEILDDSNGSNDTDSTEEVKMTNFDISNVDLKKGEVYGKPKDGPVPDIDDAPYVIELPSDVNKELLGKIKDLLTKHKGDRRVVLHIPSKESLKRIKVPFGVSIDPKFETGLVELLSK
ncbi:DNA polymerase III subunit alpha [Candidatus Peregrinibacteria bacterium]|jgi:DNA polymerase III subunit alpha|nr:DNA polymerase III subunit alpha [Candidatus Peregrinibacteria bacterium]MBT4148265.1 DNA polymerase III subunit alpha [Candidatus Peregrinibacteria bacterium]MBT4366563.1 DNA polymerase III subunit alpha [Candidatus Peregrinibacteria bacterium]MBT4455958.1 DNA polymerase III subunit alpha [Candidatus Peregrinibacteria bacterium]